MIPRRAPPVAVVPPDDPLEFDRPRDFATNYGGPRRFAQVTGGSWSYGGRSEVITPESTGSAAP